MKICDFINMLHEWDSMNDYKFKDSVSDRLDKNLAMYLKSLEYVVSHTPSRRANKVAEELTN